MMTDAAQIMTELPVPRPLEVKHLNDLTSTTQAYVCTLIAFHNHLSAVLDVCYRIYSVTSDSHLPNNSFHRCESFAVVVHIGLAQKHLMESLPLSGLRVRRYF